MGKDFRIVQEAMNIPPGSKRGEWVRHVGDKNGVSRPTVFRLIAKFKKGGLPALMRTKSTKGKSIAWTSEALGFWEGLYLYAPHCSEKCPRTDEQCRLARAAVAEETKYCLECRHDETDKCTPCLDGETKAGAPFQMSLF